MRPLPDQWRDGADDDLEQQSGEQRKQIQDRKGEQFLRRTRRLDAFAKPVHVDRKHQHAAIQSALAELTRLIASYRANIVDTLHNRAYYGVNLGDTVIDITMETRGREQVEELLAALSAAGYKHSRVL